MFSFSYKENARKKEDDLMVNEDSAVARYLNDALHRRKTVLHRPVP